MSEDKGLEEQKPAMPQDAGNVSEVPDGEEGRYLDQALISGPNAPTIGEAEKSAIPAEELERLTAEIIAALKTVYDPEIPADIYELGLIYKVDIEDDRSVKIDMTLTAPGCPVAGEMPIWVQDAVRNVEGVMDVDVEMVFDPPWTVERMSDEAQIAIGWFNS